MKKIVFMGTPDFSVPILDALHEHFNVVLVVSQPDKPFGRKRVITPPPVAKKATELNLELYQPENIREEASVKHILSFKPDIIVTAAYGQILPEALLNAPPFKCINVHASLLPKHRGGAPIHRAIIEGDEKTGVTIMYMAQRLDSGDIISQSEVEILDSFNTGILHNKLSEVGRDLLIETLPNIFTGNIHPTLQDETEVTYSPNISKSDEKVDLTKSAREVFNQIRGLSPAPGSYVTLNDDRLKLYGATMSDETSKKTAGEIIQTSHKGIHVATGDGVVIITEVQPAGKKRMKATEFLNNRHLIGTVLK